MIETLLDKLALEISSGKDFSSGPARTSQIPVPTDEGGLLAAVKAIKQLLDLREGNSGSVLDKAITLRDLIDAGALEVSLGPVTLGTADSTTSPLVFPSASVGYVDPRPVLGTPPSPTALVARGAFKNIILVWDLLDYANHAYIEVWRHTADVIGSAVKIGQSTANIYSDATGVVGTTYYYWVRAVSLQEDGSSVIGPFNAVPGTSATLAKVSTTDVAPLAITNALIGDAAIDTAKIDTLSADKITFGVMSGDRINANTLHANRITAGTFSATQIATGFLDAARINGNSITADKIDTNGLSVKGEILGGSFTAYAWPPTGQRGFYLGPNGLLIGNGPDNQFFQVEQNGNVWAPGFEIVGGAAKFFGNLEAAGGTFKGTLMAEAVNAVNSINIAGEAVVVPRSGQVIAAVLSTTYAEVLNLGTMNTTVNGAAGALYIHIDFDGTMTGPSTGGILTASFTVEVNGVAQKNFQFGATAPSNTITHKRSAPVYMNPAPTGNFTVRVMGQHTGNTTNGGDSFITVTMFALGAKR